MAEVTKVRRPLVLDRRLFAALAAASALGVPGVSAAQQAPAWVPPSWDQALLAPLPATITPGVTPGNIPEYQALSDPTGLVASYQPSGATDTSGNAFFSSLGTNGRTCFSCHQPQDDWTITPATVSSVFNATLGTDPLFAPVDGSDCPDLTVGEDPTCPEDGDDDALQRFVAVRHQLFSRGNFRIFLPLPVGAEWKVHIVHDPTGCEGSATYGLPVGFLSVYRRPLPSANTFDLDPGGRSNPVTGAPIFNIMWDAREPDLVTQFGDAVKIHTQATTPATTAQANQGAAFQNGLFTAQVHDGLAGDLTAGGALGGPRLIATLPPGLNTVAPAPVPARVGPTFTIFDAWDMAQQASRRSIKRGQDIFDGTTKTFVIQGVAGLNDVVGQDQVQGACSFCHNSGERGNDFFLDPKHMGIMDNSSTALPATKDMPLFGFLCPVGSIPYFSNPVTRGGVQYDEFLTTDPGVGLISGLCADLGKMKVPILRGVAARAPFFHGGNVATLYDLVDFYNRRFAIGFTTEERADLVHFLESL
jgi:cytochrome c peroxidase